MAKDVLPVLGARPIAEIHKDELSDLLQKIEKRAPEVARNIRNYLTGIFEYAIDAGLVTGSPVPGGKVLRPRNQHPHSAMPLNKVGQFLRAMDGSGCNRHTGRPQTICILFFCPDSLMVGQMVTAGTLTFFVGQPVTTCLRSRRKPSAGHAQGSLERISRSNRKGFCVFRSKMRSALDLTHTQRGVFVKPDPSRV